MNPIALSLTVASLLAIQPVSGEGQVLLEARDGKITERRLAEIDSPSLGDLGAAWIRFGAVELSDEPEHPDTAELEFPSGDRLRGRIVAGDEDGLVLELRGNVRIPLSIERIVSLSFPSRLPNESSALLVPAPEGDRLYRRTGDHLDRIDGAVESFSGTGVTFESVLGTRTFEWSEVGALFIEAFGETELEADAERAEAGEAVVCDLIDGSRLRGRMIRVDRRGCQLRIAGTEELQIPIAVLAEISLDDGSVAFLSDFTPTKADPGSLFGDDLGMTWPYRMDRSVTGTILKSGGRGYTRGIGVHAPSSLSFALKGKWDELRGLVAIDDQVMRLNSRGSVIFRVHVDGELAWESEVVRGGVTPINVPPIALGGAKELVLECDMATDFAVADRANWLRMVLVKFNE